MNDTKLRCDNCISWSRIDDFGDIPAGQCINADKCNTEFPADLLRDIMIDLLHDREEEGTALSYPYDKPIFGCGGLCTNYNPIDPSILDGCIAVGSGEEVE